MCSPSPAQRGSPRISRRRRDGNRGNGRLARASRRRRRAVGLRQDRRIRILATAIQRVVQRLPLGREADEADQAASGAGDVERAPSGVGLVEVRAVRQAAQRVGIQQAMPCLVFAVRGRPSLVKKTPASPVAKRICGSSGTNSMLVSARTASAGSSQAITHSAPVRPPSKSQSLSVLTRRQVAPPSVVSLTPSESSA